jgi:hypothetical protein
MNEAAINNAPQQKIPSRNPTSESVESGFSKNNNATPPVNKTKPQ